MIIDESLQKKVSAHESKVVAVSIEPFQVPDGAITDPLISHLEQYTIPYATQKPFRQIFARLKPEQLEAIANSGIPMQRISSLSVYVICPVKQAQAKELEEVGEYVAQLREAGCDVHYPFEDTRQDDPSKGVAICTQNCRAIHEANQVHIYWTAKTIGGIFDLGIVFSENLRRGLPTMLINRPYVEARAIAVESEAANEGVKPKSFDHVMMALDDQYKDLNPLSLR